MIYRLRVELAEVEPPAWRRVEVPSDLTLDRMHEVLQVAMGWTNSHLHQFFSGSGIDDPNAERYLMPFSIEEGMVGIDEQLVRLDEVLIDPGDQLWYEYDFGDSWNHRIELEDVRPIEADAALIRCLAGENACPPEDCGGIPGYQHLIEVIAGPPGDEREELLGWLGRPFDPAAFDIDAVDEALVSGKRAGGPAIDSESPLGELLANMVFGVPQPVADALHALTERAPAVSATERADAVQAYSRLLDRVGDDGIALTQAGYLPPVHVQDLAAELQVADFWGKGNREVNAVPVLEFRESAQRLGLLRKAHGRLLLTRVGLRARRDPDVLWHHITGVLPLSGSSRGAEAQAARHAGTLLLLGVATGLAREQRTSLMTAGMTAAGWHGGSQEPLPDHVVSRVVSPTSAVLKNTTVIVGGYGWPPTDPPLSATGIAFARAALRV